MSGPSNIYLSEAEVVPLELNYQNIKWKNLNVPKCSWKSLAISSSGMYQIAVESEGYIYISSNYGKTWTSNIITRVQNWIGVAISSDGLIQSACYSSGSSSGVFISSNYGATWELYPGSSGYNYTSVAMSNSGSIQLFGVSLGIPLVNYLNNNQNNLETTNLLPGIYTSVAVSGDGSPLIAAVAPNQNIWISNDYGLSWSNNNNSGLNNWTGIALSNDGQIITAVAAGDYIYTSNKSGTIWFQSDAPQGNWSNIAMDSTGQFQSACEMYGYVYTSSNYGKNWTKNVSLGISQWNSIAMSSNGQYIIVSDYCGEIYGTFIASDISPEVSTGFVTLSTNLSTEVSRAVNAEKSLSTVLSNEVYRAVFTETSIVNLITPSSMFVSSSSVPTGTLNISSPFKNIYCIDGASVTTIILPRPISNYDGICLKFRRITLLSAGDSITFQTDGTSQDLYQFGSNSSDVIFNWNNNIVCCDVYCHNIGDNNYRWGISLL
jgi:hypothetical protein